ncbi:MAG TPA: acyltransferase [Kofleriaceae bacterium]|nr:acyltransferase [Kofleriaceae bacterium]
MTESASTSARAAPGAERAEIVAMTSMRGVAAALVVAYHLEGRGYESWVRGGYLWVDFFFLLSGFIMAYVYGPMFERGVSLASYRAFLGKRIARIYPLHLFMLCAYVTCGAAGVSACAGGVHGFLTNLFLVQAWGTEHDLTWNRVAWSISAEFGFYLVFPFIARAIAITPRLLHAIAPVALLGGLVLLVHHTGTLGVTYDFALIRCIFEATIGMLLYQVMRDPAPGVTWLATRDWVRWPLLVAPLVLMQLHAHEVAIVAVFALMILPLAFADGSLDRFLRWAPVHHTGVVSYSLYMCHYLVLIFVGAALKRVHLAPSHDDLGLATRIAVHLGFLVLCVAVATPLYRLVEVPGRRAINRYFALRRARYAPARV